MPKCQNGDFYYTGKEPSPRGLGFHASPHQVNDERIGKNGKVWHVVKFGSGIKRWQEGQAPTSKYVSVGQLLKMKQIPNLGIGIAIDQEVYREESWCCYHYKKINDHHVKVIKNDLGIPLQPVLVEDFKKWISKNSHQTH